MALRYNSYLLYLLMLVLQWVVGFKAWSNALASKDKTTFSTKPQLSPLAFCLTKPCLSHLMLCIHMDIEQYRLFIATKLG